jgi:NAD(P)H-hydrate epimerase
MSESEPVVRLTRAQMREIDRRASEDYHIPGIVLMENAARGVADVISDVLKDLDQPDPAVLIVCGGGNNGGDGFALARHLHNRRIAVAVIETVSPDRLRGDALLNRTIVSKMGLQLVRHEELLGDDPYAWDIIVDALFGTGLERPPSDEAARWIESMNMWQHVTAIDVPSGLDCDTGEPLGDHCVQALRTVTFVAEKAGFANPKSEYYTGEVVVADIGCPRQLIDAVRRDVP